MPRSFNTDRIRNNLLVDAIVPLVEQKTLTIAEYLSDPINKAVDAFFKNLTAYMGLTADLASQVPGSQAPAWKALSKEYAARKSAALFWIYTLDAKPAHARIQSLQRKSRTGKVSKAKIKKAVEDRDPLIQALAKLVGTDVFGGVEVEVKDWNNQTIYREKIRRVSVHVERSRRARAYDREVNRTDRTNIAAIHYTITLRLWSKYAQGDFGNIESKIGLSLLNARKLIGRASYQRPLIAPFMTYYSRVVIPGVIKETLDKKGLRYNNMDVKTTVSTRGKFGGPL